MKIVREWVLPVGIGVVCGMLLAVAWKVVLVLALVAVAAVVGVLVWSENRTG